MWSPEIFYKEYKLNKCMNNVLSFPYVKGEPTVRINSDNPVSFFADDTSRYIIQNEGEISFHQGNTLDIYLSNNVVDFIKDINKKRSCYLVKNKFPNSKVIYDVKYIVQSLFFKDIFEMVRSIPRDQVWVIVNNKLSPYQLERDYRNIVSLQLEMVRNLPNNSTRLLLYLLTRIRLKDADKVEWVDIYRFYNCTPKNGRRSVTHDLDELVKSGHIIYSVFNKYFKFKLTYKRDSVLKVEHENSNLRIEASGLLDIKG